MISSTSTYRVSINYQSKVILLSKPLKECEYFNNNPNYIDDSYNIRNNTVKVYKDIKHNRESHYTPNYKTALTLFNQLKQTKKNYFFYNSLDN